MTETEKENERTSERASKRERDEWIKGELAIRGEMGDGKCVNGNGDKDGNRREGGKAARKGPQKTPGCI